MNIIIFGPPGSGKGTEAKLLAKDLKLKHISTGEIFRKELKNKTKLGIDSYEKYWSKGILVPDEITIEVLKNAMKNIKDGFILDGFPRTLEQGKAFDTIANIDNVIVLDVPYHTLKARLLKRAQIEKRSDDTPETIKKRFQVYREQTAPLIKYYKDKIILIDGDRSMQDVERDIIGFLKNANRNSKIKS